MKMRSENAKKIEINEHMMSSWKSQLLISNLQVLNIGITCKEEVKKEELF